MEQLSNESREYFENLGKEIEKCYEIARKARAKGLDPVDEVEVPLALTMAEKVIKLVSTQYRQLDDENIINRILELEKEYGALDPTISFRIAEEIAKQKYCKFDSQLEAMDAGIRIGWAYITLGVVSTPIEGYTGIKTGKTQNGNTYLKAYFSGPIRSAGTTAGCVGVILIDYIRQLFGYAKYDPLDVECKRTVTELYDYHERITNLQYLPTEEEVYFIAKNLPIQITGDKTEKKEVSNYKNLARIETDFIRGGLCLVIGEAIAQKAAKGLRILRNLQKNGLQINDWEWLEDYIELHNKREKSKDLSPTYIKDLVAGRPVLGHPGKGFRFRYGRSRLSGFSAVSIHPASMAVTNNFIATGTQLKIEKPTKGCIVTPCNEIDGPIVKLKNGSVKKLNYEEAKKLYYDIEEIIYLGDILFSFGDIINRNAFLVKPGYVEEYWVLELEKNQRKVQNFWDVSIEEAIEISNKFKIPLYPKYIFYWTQINYKQFLGFIDWLQHSRISNGKLLFPYNSSEKERFKIGKRALELLGVEHQVGIENVILDNNNTRALLVNLGFDINEEEINFKHKFDSEEVFYDRLGNENEGDKILEIVNELSKIKIKDKAGEFIGARMGRPEKAKLRKLKGNPNILFPVGSEGGRLRSVNEAVEKGFAKADFPFNYCENCKKESIYRICENCSSRTIKKYFCKICFMDSNEKCKIHNSKYFKNTKIDIRYYFEKAREKLSISKFSDLMIKGVRGTSSENHDLENLAKGILRAKYNLNVNKDGTIRYDMTEIPLTHFKPKEINARVSKLIDLGYKKDYLGNQLIDENQILELKPHDVIIPCNDEAGDEKGDELFINISKYLDELLEKFYEINSFFSVSKKEDLIGQLGVTMAPHNCAGVICRIIGFTKTQGLIASPYLHAAMRRDCLGYDNYVAIEKNGVWKIDKIGNIVENLQPNQLIDNFGTLKKDLTNFNTWSNPGKKEIKEVTKHTPTKMLKIYLEDGRKIDVTNNHKLYLKGKKEKRACDLVLGDKLVVSYNRNIQEKTLSNIFLPEIFEHRDDIMIRNVYKYLSTFEKMRKHENFCERDSFPIKIVKNFLEKHNKSLKDLPEDAKIAIKRDNVSLPLNIPIEEDLLEVIGLYIAEGHLRKNNSMHEKKGFYQVSIASSSEEIRSFIKKTFYRYFMIKPTEDNKNRVTFSSRILYELFKDYLNIGHNAHSKRIPPIFLNLEKKKLLCLLRGYFEGDGSVSLSDIRVCCDTVSEGLKYDLSFVLSRLGIFVKFYDYEKKPGPKVREFYIKKKREIPKFKITKIIVPSNFVKNFKEIGFLSDRKNNILDKICKRNPYGMKIDFDEHYIYPKIMKIEDIGEKSSYCFNIPKEHNFFTNDVLVHNCDGDECSLSLLLDVLINFSKFYLPSHRGATQDAPLVLNGKISAREVDEQILDFELVDKYSLELYKKAEQKLHSSQAKIETVKQRINADPYINIGFTHNIDDFNESINCSSYKLIPTMQEKVIKQMELCEKLRSVDHTDVARLVIDRHFMRDLKGNLRKFTQQNFRCGKCNEIYRRPPLNGKCDKCNYNLIFTIAYGSIIKYLEPALSLAKNYNVPSYIKQDLELTKKYIESVFGKENEKQESIKKWF